MREKIRNFSIREREQNVHNNFVATKWSRGPPARTHSQKYILYSSTANLSCQSLAKLQEKRL